VPDTVRDILIPLNENLEATDRLANALDATREHWPHVSQCWIDQTLEPTPLLEKHRLRRRA
jgi:hypothetical protein